jgi:hypothetical protein
LRNYSEEFFRAIKNKFEKTNKKYLELRPKILVKTESPKNPFGGGPGEPLFLFSRFWQTSSRPSLFVGALATGSYLDLSSNIQLSRDGSEP